TSSRQNFEVRLYENPALSQRFDVVYGTINTTGADHPYVGGVQGISPRVTQDFCGTTPPQNVSRTYTIQPCCQFRVLIVYADSSGAPTQLQSELLAQSGITAVDPFDGAAATPTLAQLQAYDIVLPFSNSGFSNADT